MDGTVVDTEGIWLVAAEHILEKHGVRLTEDERKRVHNNINGASLSETSFYLKMWLPSAEDASSVMHELIDAAQTYYAEGVSYIPGFREFHKNAVAQGYTTALVTNADRHMLHMTDRALDLRQFFGDNMFCVDDVNGTSKPSPLLYQHAAQRLGIQPEEAVVIEDSAPGIRAAIDAGAYCIGINTNGDRNHVSQAHEVVDSYGEIDLAA